MYKFPLEGCYSIGIPVDNRFLLSSDEDVVYLTGLKWNLAASNLPRWKSTGDPSSLRCRALIKGFYVYPHLLVGICLAKLITPSELATLIHSDTRAVINLTKKVTYKIKFHTTYRLDVSRSNIFLIADAPLPIHIDEPTAEGVSTNSSTVDTIPSGDKDIFLDLLGKGPTKKEVI